MKNLKNWKFWSLNCLSSGGAGLFSWNIEFEIPCILKHWAGPVFTLLLTLCCSPGLFETVLLQTCLYVYPCYICKYIFSHFSYKPVFSGLPPLIVIIYCCCCLLLVLPQHFCFHIKSLPPVQGAWSRVCSCMWSLVFIYGTFVSSFYSYEVVCISSNVFVQLCVCNPVLEMTFFNLFS